MKVLNAEETKTISQEKYAVVDFFATWCGPCMYMKPFYEKAESTLTKIGVKCFEVNVDECDDFSAKNKIQFVPTVILFENGKEINRFTGAKEEEGIIEFVKNSINK